MSGDAWINGHCQNPLACLKGTTSGLVHRSNLFDCLVGAAVRRPLPLKQPFSAAAALRIAPIEDVGAGDASVYGVSPCTRCMLTMLPLVTTLPAIGD